MVLSSGGNLQMDGAATVSGGKVTIDGTDSTVAAGTVGLAESGGILTISGRHDINFKIDNDNNGAASYVYANGAGTEISNLDESGNLQMDGDLTVSGGDITSANTITSGTNAILPHIILDSTSSGDSWTSQGAYISIGESASAGSGTAALYLSYLGTGMSYIGSGGMTSGVPNQAYWRFAYSTKDIYTDSDVEIAGDLQVDGNIAGSKTMLGGIGGNFPASSTWYISFSGANGGTETVMRQPISYAGTARNLYGRTSIAPGSTRTIVYTVMRNGAATGVTCTITSTARTCSDTSNTQAYNANDYWTIRVVSSAGIAITHIGATMEFTST